MMALRIPHGGSPVEIRQGFQKMESLVGVLSEGASGELLVGVAVNLNPVWQSVTDAIDHGEVGGLGDDDHTQYHTDARGDARYYTETELDAGQLDNRYFTEAEHLTASAGAADSGKPIALDAAGHIDATMINDGDIDHGEVGGLGDDDHTQYLLADGTRDLAGNMLVNAGITIDERDLSVDGTKLDTIETNADVTDTANVTAAGAAMDGGAFHNGFSDFVGNEHVDHSGVDITAGSGISGGGDLTVTRTVDLDINSLDVATIAAGDFVPFWDITATATNKKITFANFEAALVHDNLSGYVVNEHIDWTNTAENLATTGTLNAIELFNSGGNLKVQPDVQGDVELFGDTDVGDADSGKILKIHRKAVEGDNYIYLYVSSNQLATFFTDADLVMQVGAGKFIKLTSFDDLLIDLGDDAGVNKIDIRDSGNNTVATIDSDGNASFVSTTGAFDFNSLAVATIAAGDFVPFWDITATATSKKTTFANFEAALTHDNLVAGTIASHDTTATGANLTTLTDDSMADTLHRHSELSADDGTPDRALEVRNNGFVGIGGIPGVEFDVWGRIRVKNSTETGTTLVIEPATDENIYIKAAAAGGDASIIWRTGSGSTDSMRMDEDGKVAVGIGVWADARFEVQTASGEGTQAVTIDQNDADQAFIDFQGTSAASAANNISTWKGGNTIQGFTRQEINGAVQWMPYYDAPTVATERYYPRRLNQEDLPTAGSGADEIEEGELLMWHDSDGTDVCIVYNDPSNGIVSQALN